jgi:hypothetical protein
MPIPHRLSVYSSREAIILGIPVLYLVIVAMMIFNVPPVRDYIEENSTVGVLASIFGHAMQFPYVERVRSKMLSMGLSDALIVVKLNFLAASFVIMATIYGIAFALAIILFLAKGITGDPVVNRLRQFPISSHLVALPFYGIVLGGSGLCAYIAIDGIGLLAPSNIVARWTDHIVTNDFSIIRSIFFMSASLFLLLVATRSALCYIALSRIFPNSMNAGSSS